MENRSFYTNIIYKNLFEGTKEYSEEYSSSVQYTTLSFSSRQIEEITIDKEVTETSTKQLDNSVFSELERLVVKRNAIDEEIEKDKLVKRLIRELELSLDLFGEESEDFSSAEKKITEIEHTWNMRILGEVIQDIYVHHFDNPMYLIGICKSLLRYDIDEVHPWGIAMLTGFLNHPDETVKEYAIQLIDNWCDAELLPILRTLQVTSEWLKDYISAVVEDLERENVLYQKTV